MISNPTSALVQLTNPQEYIKVRLKLSMMLLGWLRRGNLKGEPETDARDVKTRDKELLGAKTE